VFKNFLDIDKWIKRFTVQGWPGAYLRIITEGEVGAGDGVVIAHRPAHGVTIGEVFRGFSGERSLAPRLLLAEELPEENLDRVRAWLAGTAKPFELDGD
jgi:MOSC domain-containing protein YiiM